MSSSGERRRDQKTKVANTAVPDAATDRDLVGVHHRGEAVRHQHDRRVALPYQSVARRLHRLLRVLATDCHGEVRAVACARALKPAHGALNLEADRLFRVRADEIKASEDRLKNLLFKQQFDLLDLKEMKPGEFRGRRSENFKPWARKLKAYCNGKRDGFRRALEWAEAQKQEITDLSGSGWEPAAAADTKLHDFLLQLLVEDALLLVQPQAHVRPA